MGIDILDDPSHSLAVELEMNLEDDDSSDQNV